TGSGRDTGGGSVIFLARCLKPIDRFRSSGNVAAWIEVELGGENAQQLGAYRTSLNEPVKSIVGLTSSGGDLSLEAIASAVNELIVYFDRQQAKAAGILTQLISELAHPPKGSQYQEPGSAIREAPLIKALQVQLSGILTFGIPPVKPGKVLVTTMAEHGWTIRVYSKVSKIRTVQLMNKPTASKMVRIPALSHLNRYLPHATQAVEEYAAFMRELSVDIAKLEPRGHIPVEEEALQTRVDRLADHIRALAHAYGGVTHSVSSI
ncbi:MAG: hypothetical protein NTZ05_15985, partial [Chloroflexi bacterium]|nr:hypothetical protein [Chloroflexota bacterium]